MKKYKPRGVLVPVETLQRALNRLKECASEKRRGKIVLTNLSLIDRSISMLSLHIVEGRKKKKK